MLSSRSLAWLVLALGAVCVGIGITWVVQDLGAQRRALRATHVSPQTSPTPGQDSAHADDVRTAAAPTAKSITATVAGATTPDQRRRPSARPRVSRPPKP
ncbi:MAG: hypothetical protein ACPGUV_14105, partial [Polyangiales bacterium]